MSTPKYTFRLLFQGLCFWALRTSPSETKYALLLDSNSISEAHPHYTCIRYKMDDLVDTSPGQWERSGNEPLHEDDMEIWVNGTPYTGTLEKVGDPGVQGTINEDNFQ